MPASYRVYKDLRDDFEARIRILTPEEGGRQLPPSNGMRWDFQYALDKPARCYMHLYPDFYDPTTNNSWRELPLPIDEWLYARLYFFSAEARAFHQQRIRCGTSFYCVEGSRIVAEGTVTRITGLFEER
ncbi:hypothetical protein [Hymenobacter psychrotolerans]|uniref:Uncharacterized protein n=1 Tax=Hymenobacter psychrotolerans DSM 18569 TaxID=1121959 RepID=A0A1M6UJV8_9BACT|nr:hypothetical protein [Hymenobacter psychrotolerans]SHK69471.1 hypothetical protein SAMN02746009_01386 [Hymenobacter psychrotolerans DSM 18569]